MSLSSHHAEVLPYKCNHCNDNMPNQAELITHESTYLAFDCKLLEYSRIGEFTISISI